MNSFRKFDLTAVNRNKMQFPAIIKGKPSDPFFTGPVGYFFKVM
jgi:hypothetical protein